MLKVLLIKVMKKIYFLSVIYLVLLTSVEFYAQLNGNYTIDPNASATSTNYKTISSAISDLSAGARADGGPAQGLGVSGPVIFNIADGIYNEQLAITPITGSSPTNTITFQSISQDSSAVIIQSACNGPEPVLYFNGCKNISVKWLTIKLLNDANAAVCQLENVADNITIENCHLLGYNTNNANSTVILYNSNNNKNFTLSYSRVEYGSLGIYVLGNNSTAGTTIKNNIFINQYGMAVYSYSTDLLFTGNTIQDRIDGSGAIDYYGMAIANSSMTTTIRNNTFNIINTSEIINAFYGGNVIIDSNIFNIKSTGYLYGIDMYRCGYTEITNNNFDIIADGGKILYIGYFGGEGIVIGNKFNINPLTSGESELQAVYTIKMKLTFADNNVTINSNGGLYGMLNRLLYQDSKIYDNNFKLRGKNYWEVFGIYGQAGNSNNYFDNTFNIISSGDNSSAYGIYSSQENDVNYFKNNFDTIQAKGSNAYASGLYVNGSNNFSAYQNKFNIAAQDSADGISMNGAGSHSNIYNNFVPISGTCTGGAHGVYINNYNYLELNNNNINLSSSILGSANNYGVYIDLITNDDLKMRNNIIANQAGGYAIFDSLQFIKKSDYNDLYTSGNILGYRNGHPFSNLNDWKTANDLDSHSVSVNPGYYSDTNLHVCNHLLDGTGDPLNSDTLDIDGETRSSPPDIGADEFTSNPYTFDLGNDYSFCYTTSLSVPPLVNGVYQWSDGSTGQSISLMSTGTYSVSVTDNICINNIDVITVTKYNSSVSLDLGADSVKACHSIILNSENPGFPTLWSNGATTSGIEVDETGIYSVIITDNVCSFFDTIAVSIYNSSISLDFGEDAMEVCNSIVLNSGNPGFPKIWSNGATTQTIDVHESGTYSVLVSDDVCAVADTITLTIYSSSITTDLGNDSAKACHSFLLNAGNPSFPRLWSNGSMAQSIEVTESGIYSVAVTDYICQSTDSIFVDIHTDPVITIDAYSSPCNGMILNAGVSGMLYSWSTGANTQTIEVNKSGKYSVSVSDETGCSGNDTIVVGHLLNDIFATPLISTCSGTQLLTAGNQGAVYNWSTGATTQEIIVNATGNYNVMVTAPNGCVFYDTIMVIVNACVGITGPPEGNNSFTIYPNPNSGEFTISFTVPDKEVLLTIANSTGATIYYEKIPGQTGVFTKTIHMPSGISPGIYFLQFNVNGNFSYKKIILNNNIDR